MRFLIAIPYGCWRPVLLLAYLSILQEGRNLARFKHLVLVHAARFSRDLSYLPLMQQLEQRYNGKLRIQTVVSREEAPGSLTGRVPALIENGLLEAAVGLKIDGERDHVMLCGNPQMVRDTQQTLKDQRQMKKHLRRKPSILPASITGKYSVTAGYQRKKGRGLRPILIFSQDYFALSAQNIT